MIFDLLQDIDCFRSFNNLKFLNINIFTIKAKGMHIKTIPYGAITLIINTLCDKSKRVLPIMSKCFIKKTY